MSPIHDQSYRRYQGRREPLGRSWMVITRAGILNALSRKAFLALLVLAWIPFIVFVIYSYVQVVVPQAALLASIDSKLFVTMLEVQSFFVFFVTIFIGSGLIASDRRANALQIYLSKPLLRIEYIGGKLMILVTFLLFVTLVPAFLLLIVHLLFVGSLDFLRTHILVVPGIVVASLVRVLVAAFTMLALSSLSKSTRYVAILYTGTIFFTNSVFLVLRLITNSTRVAWVSIGANIDQVTDAAFRQTPRYDTPVIVSVLVLAGIVALSISVLERRIKGVEVVK